MRAVGLPPELARRGIGVLRPRDATSVYAHPRPEFARLAKRGVLRRLAYGYYAIVPQARIGDSHWRPDLNATALGIAVADYGMNAVTLMGTSAARHHGALPRAIAAAVVAIPRQRPTLALDIGQVIFVRRRFDSLDTELITTELLRGWVTTVEQTLLDIADRPALGGLTPASAKDAVQALALRADWNLLAELAHRQRKQRAERTARVLAEKASDA